MTRIYLLQRMSYPVADDIRMHVTKNIFVADSANIFVTKNLSYSVANYVKVTKNIFVADSANIFVIKNLSYSVANHVRMRVTKSILCDRWHEHTSHKECPILWQITKGWASLKIFYVTNIYDTNVFVTKNVLSCGRRYKGARLEKYI